jgi:CYTH domain-containing protein
MIEIERKFLLKSASFIGDIAGNRITQGYLTTDPNRTVRVRIRGGSGTVTIKGKSNESGLSRYEWEKEIPVVEAQALLEIALPGIIDKTRYVINFKGFNYEVDVFHGANKGLLLAELELEDELQPFLKPDWLGDEVTGDKRYYNSYLSEQAFTSW